MNIQKDLDELVEAGLITSATAETIRGYYEQKKGSSTNRLFIVFGILGALLVGLGIILIIAHNWDHFSKGLKTFFAFLPLVLGHLLCGFTLFKKYESTAWRESSATFLFFAVGATISLISQIYNIPGNLTSYLLTWMLLCIPLVYVMNSSMASLLVLIGISYYACELSYWTYPNDVAYYYWLMLLSLLPFYYQLYKTKPKSNFTAFHHWFIPLSLIICLGSLADSFEDLMVVAYMSMFGLFYLVGHLDYFQNQKHRNNGYGILGSLGLMIMLLTFSFDWFWKDLMKTSFGFPDVFLSHEFLATTVFTVLACILLYRRIKAHTMQSVRPLMVVFLLFILVYLIGQVSTVATLFVNLIVFSLGILTIREGAKSSHLGILNYGLGIIATLIVCRFFDTNLSFVVRGILFLLVGTGFFVANYWMLKKRKSHEN